MAKESNSKNDTLKIVILIGIMILIALLITVIVLLIKGGKQGEAEENTPRNVVVNQENVEDVVDDMVLTPYVQPGYYSASMTNVWHFATADAISEDAFVENKEENTNDVYFDVFLASDENTPILESPVLPRGTRLDNISLDKALEPGTYDCVMIYHLIDENQNTVSTLRVGITIIIEN